MAIYTRTGDKGTTSLFNGRRVSKADLRVDALGMIDELNSAIGVTLAENQKSKIKNQKYKSKLKNELEKIQSDLLSIGSSLASPTFSSQLSTLNLRVRDFEHFIDQMTEKMPALKNFILPGGGKTGAMLHLSRAICRRVERGVVELNNKDPLVSLGHGKIDSNIIIYFNRLSDLLFTMSRFVNFKEKRKEIIWPAYVRTSAGKRKKL